MRRRPAALVLVLMLMTMGAVPIALQDSAGAVDGAPPADRFVLADAQVVVVPGNDPQAPGGTYPQEHRSCTSPYAINSCGGAEIHLRFTNVDAFPRPTQGTCYTFPSGGGSCEAGHFSGTATVHRIFGCATPEGDRVPELDRHVSDSILFSGPLRSFFFVPLDGDEARVTLSTILGMDHPHHCPAGLRDAQWELVYDDLTFTLLSRDYPAWTYHVVGPWSWRSDDLRDGDGRGPKDKPAKDKPANDHHGPKDKVGRGHRDGDARHDGRHLVPWLS